MYLYLVLFAVFLFSFGLFEVIVINEEILLCLCFFTFVLVCFVSSNNDIFNNLNQKSKGIKITLFDSIVGNLGVFVNKNQWFFISNWKSKPKSIFSIYCLWGCYESKTNILENKINFQKNNLIFLQESWVACNNWFYNWNHSFILSRLSIQINSILKK